MTSLLSLTYVSWEAISHCGQDTIFSVLSRLGLPKYWHHHYGSLSWLDLIFNVYCFFKTGQALIATGDNEKMARALGINTRKMTSIWLDAPCAIALAGAILAQNNGCADVRLRSLNHRYCSCSWLLSGEILRTSLSMGRLVCILYGSIIYRLLLILVLLLNVFQTKWLQTHLSSTVLSV